MKNDEKQKEINLTNKKLKNIVITGNSSIDDFKYKWSKVGSMLRQPEKSDGEVFDKFIKHFGFDEYRIYTPVHSLKTLLEGNSGYNSGTHYDTSENFRTIIDHGELYRNSVYRNVMLVGHDYVVDKKELSKLCEKLDFQYIIYPKSHSWYYPDNTYLVIIMSNDTCLKNFNKLASFDKQAKLSQ